MENKEVKMHSMISSVSSDLAGASRSLEKTVIRYDFNKIRTIREAITNNSPSLVDAKNIVAARDPLNTVVTDMLQLMIAKTCRAFNVPRNIDVSQIPIVAEDILEDYYYLRLSEIYYVLKRARKGFHRKNYERIDVETVNGWFEDYVSNEREPFYEQENYLKHDAATSAERSRQYDDFVSVAHKNVQDENRRVSNNAAHGVARKLNFNKRNK